MGCLRYEEATHPILVPALPAEPGRLRRTLSTLAGTANLITAELSIESLLILALDTLSRDPFLQ